MDDCIFCKIIAGEIPGNTVYEDDHWYAFRDIEPCAPVHVLLVPKRHVKNILALDDESAKDFADFFQVVQKIAARKVWRNQASASSSIREKKRGSPYSISTPTSSAGKTWDGRPSRKKNKENQGRRTPRGVRFSVQKYFRRAVSPD